MGSKPLHTNKDIFGFAFGVIEIIQKSAGPLTLPVTAFTALQSTTDHDLLLLESCDL
jgi:hypothetical protein